MTATSSNVNHLSAAVTALGPTTDIVTAGRFIGISRTQAYALASKGDYPITCHRVGKLYRVPITALRKFLELDE